MKLVKKELGDLRFRLLTILLLIAGIGYFVIGYHDLFVRSIHLFEIEQALDHPLISRFYSPEQIMQELEMLVANIDLYVWSQWFGKNFYQLTLLACILLGFPLFARENEQGTGEYLLMNLTRAQVYGQKLAAGGLALLSCVAVGSLLPALMAPFYPYDFSLVLSLKYGLHMAAGAAFLFALVVLFSVVFDDAVKPIIASILAFAFLSLVGWLDPTGTLYIYRYMMGVDLFFFQVMAWEGLALLLLLAGLVYWLGWVVYSRRDI